MTRKPIRTYCVHVDGHTDALYSARSPGKARAAAYREFTAAYAKTCREFLAISSVHRVADPPASASASSSPARRLRAASDAATTASGSCGTIAMR